MYFLRYRVRFPDGDKELTDTQAVDGVIPPDHRTADVVQVQGSHDIQAGTTARWIFFCFNGIHEYCVSDSPP